MFQLQERLSKWRQRFAKNGFKKSVFFFFCQKNSKFCTFWTIRFSSNFVTMWSKYVSNNVWKTSDLRCQHLQKWYEKIQILILFSNLMEKSWFSNRIFYVIITNADIESLKSLHTLFDKYLNHMLMKFEQNRMLRNIQNFELFGKKMVNHFWESIDAILDDVVSDWTKCLMKKNYQFKDYHLSVFQNIR